MGIFCDDEYGILVLGKDDALFCHIQLVGGVLAECVATGVLMLAEADGGILDVSGVFYGDDSEFVGSFFIGKGNSARPCRSPR